MKDEKKPSDPDTPAKAQAPSEKKKDDGTPPKKPGYVFKIVPADPKNAFDFEDVADK